MMIGILQAGYIVVFLRINIGYARVSSYDQKKDLQTQIKVLNQFAERQEGKFLLPTWPHRHTNPHHDGREETINH